jgi:IS30 family transposase
MFQRRHCPGNSLYGPIAGTLNKAALRAFHPVSGKAQNTLTVDKGKEFAAHPALSAALSMDLYFAHPYHSWERGFNEHTNGLIRQYLPKKVSFATLTQKQLDKIVAKINNRPRKVLGYLTPLMKFFRRDFRTSKKIPRLL